MKYKIIRFYKNKKNKVLKRDITFKEAKEHCNDPKTRKEGVYFDGFEQELCTKCKQPIK